MSDYLSEFLEHESIPALRDRIRHQSKTVEQADKELAARGKEIQRLQALIVDFCGQIAALHAVQTGAGS